MPTVVRGGFAVRGHRASFRWPQGRGPSTAGVLISGVHAGAGPAMHSFRFNRLRTRWPPDARHTNRTTDRRDAKTGNHAAKNRSKFRLASNGRTVTNVGCTHIPRG